MISRQTTIPAYFHSLLEDLLLAQSYLQAANFFTSLLESDTPELAECIADGLTACEQGLNILSNFRSYSDGAATDE
jgi:hypothetical protein